MGDSLRDQLLKQGLATKKQVKDAAHAERKARKKEGKTPDDLAKEREEREEQRLKEKAERDRELNRQRDLERAEKEKLAQVRELIKEHRIQTRKARIEYRFDHEGKVRTFHVTEEQRAQLSRGQLAIAYLDKHYHLLPEEAGEKLLERMPKAVAWFLDPEKVADEEVAEEDDPYADYKVPDDLMW